MAFGIKREELQAWKQKINNGEIAFITHYWLDDRFPGIRTVTKVGCGDLERLIAWGKSHGIDPKYIHDRTEYPHFDLLGQRQIDVLKKEDLLGHLQRFK